MVRERDAGMSNHIVSLVFKRKVGRGALKQVLTYMADKASDDGSGVWVSKSRVSDDLEVSKRTVQRVFDELQNHNLIVQVGRRKCRNGYTVEYALRLSNIKRLPSTRVEEPKKTVLTGDTMSPQSPDLTGDTMSPVTPCHPTGDTMTPHGVTPCHPNSNGIVREPLDSPFYSPNSDLLGAPVEDASAKKLRKRAVALPAEWVPSDRNIADAQDMNFTEEAIRHEAAQFRDFHLAKGSTFKCWDASWRTWLRNVEKFGGRRSRPTGGPDRIERIISSAAEGTSGKDWG